MATKNLARTVLEGGRERYNQFQRNYSHRQERSYARQYFARCGSDLQALDGRGIRKRPGVYKHFTDKLNPVRRWLRSQVGRRWDKVRSEVFTTFDTRTLAGYHVVVEHLLREVVRYGDCGADHGWNRFLVDKHGILREQPVKWPKKKKRLCEPSRAIDAWLAGRRVQKCGSKVYWFVPVDAEAQFYRQGHKLNDTDKKRFEKLCPMHRRQIGPRSGPLDLARWCVGKERLIFPG